MFTVEVQVGRIIEARITELRTLERAVAYGKAVSQLIKQSSGHEQMILCADHRAVAIYPQAVTDELAILFGINNHRLERVAILVAASNATLSMQLGRLVREAHNPGRRVFLAASEAEAFLGEIVTAAERTRLAQFLAS
jgi:hypothetical protein